MENYEQRTVVRKKDKALLAALAIFAIVVACIAIVGVLLIRPDNTVTQATVCAARRHGAQGRHTGQDLLFYG